MLAYLVKLPFNFVLQGNPISINSGCFSGLGVKATNFHQFLC